MQCFIKEDNFPKKTYSYLKASTGLILEALSAGTTPESAPVSVANKTNPIKSVNE